MFTLNQTVVLGSYINNLFHPISHNSQEFPQHSSRCTIVKLTKTFTIVTSNGTTWKVRNQPLPGHRHDVVLSIEEAKHQYKLTLQHYQPSNKSSDQFINQCVDQL